MVRSDEFFHLSVDLEYTFPSRENSIWCGINQSVLNAYNYKHNLPMERVEKLNLDKAKDIFLEFYYLPIKTVINPEMHFNFIDVYFTNGRSAYNEMIHHLGDNYILKDIYEWRTQYYTNIYPKTSVMSPWLERLSKIKSYFKHR